jgi:hypothetical protein
MNGHAHFHNLNINGNRSLDETVLFTATDKTRRGALLMKRWSESIMLSFKLGDGRHSQP